MPSVSRAQHRLIAAKAAKGVKWAKEWLSHDEDWKTLPERKTKTEDSQYGLGKCCKVVKPDYCDSCDRTSEQCVCESFQDKLDRVLGLIESTSKGASKSVEGGASKGAFKGSIAVSKNEKSKPKAGTRPGISGR